MESVGLSSQSLLEQEHLLGYSNSRDINFSVASRKVKAQGTERTIRMCSLEDSGSEDNVYSGRSGHSMSLGGSVP